MYIYFKSINSVLTCDTYPAFLSVDTIVSCDLHDMCNKWEKIETGKGKRFTLSYKYSKYSAIVCDCSEEDNARYAYLPDFAEYQCYGCGISKKGLYEEGTRLYLQNSGSIDCVCVGPSSRFCDLEEIEGYPNVYRWCNEHASNPEPIFALHVTDNNLLSDANMSGVLEAVKDRCHMTFVEELL